MKKIIKKVAIATLSLLIVSVSALPILAQGGQFDIQGIQEEALLSIDVHTAPMEMVEALAHMDISETSDELTALVLSARNTIIFGDQMWSVHGGSFVTDADGTVTYAPLFSDLFPGWDVPVVRVERSFIPFNNTSFDGNVSLAAPPSDTMSEPFFRFNNGSSTTATAYVFSAPSDLVNLGLTNEDTGACHDWFPNLNRGQRVTFRNLVNGTRYGVRASTNGTAGMARIRVN